MTRILRLKSVRRCSSDPELPSSFDGWTFGKVLPVLVDDRLGFMKVSTQSSVIRPDLVTKLTETSHEIDFPPLTELVVSDERDIRALMRYHGAFVDESILPSGLKIPRAIKGHRWRIIDSNRVMLFPIDAH